MMDILFWSGGKDAYLAHEFYRKQFPERHLKLLTTFTDEREMVPHQKIPIGNIKRQAKKLDCELELVGLPENCPNDMYLQEVEKTLKNQSEKVENLVFGDWYLADIRRWREEQFGELGYNCLFPIWQKSLDKLLPELLLKPVEVRISAVAEEFKKIIRVGETYNQQFVRQLPEEIDPMGEKGEFHTEVSFKKWDESPL